MRFVYADPPYPGQGVHHYEGREVFHPALLSYLVTFDAWALSTNSTTLGYVLPYAPADVRIGAWVKPFASFKSNVDPAYAWEPVLFQSARTASKNQDTIRDWTSANITLQRGVAGAKPEQFCFWMFDLLGATPDDGFVDLFPGSGAVTDAWDKWCANRPLALTYR